MAQLKVFSFIDKRVLLLKDFCQILAWAVSAPSSLLVPMLDKFYFSWAIKPPTVLFLNRTLGKWAWSRWRKCLAIKSHCDRDKWSKLVRLERSNSATRSNGGTEHVTRSRVIWPRVTAAAADQTLLVLPPFPVRSPLFVEQVGQFWGPPSAPLDVVVFVFDAVDRRVEEVQLLLLLLLLLLERERRIRATSGQGRGFFVVSGRNGEPQILSVVQYLVRPEQKRAGMGFSSVLSTGNKMAGNPDEEAIKTLETSFWCLAAVKRFKRFSRHNV